MRMFIEVIVDELADELGDWVHAADMALEALHLSRRKAGVDALGKHLRCGLFGEQLCGFRL